MASINISEDDFTVCALAAHAAQNTGQYQQALSLDKLARKINASLSNVSVPRIPGFKKEKGLSWKDMPSILKS